MNYPQYNPNRFCFSEGLAPVMIGGKIGYIDKSGKVEINPQFDSAYAFYGGLAVVVKVGRISYINKHGEYVWREKDPTNLNSSVTTSNANSAFKAPVDYGGSTGKSSNVSVSNNPHIAKGG